MGLLYDLTVNRPKSDPQKEISVTESTVRPLRPEDKLSTASYTNILFAAPLAMESYSHSSENMH